MSLIELWKKTPSQIEDKHLQQLIAFAGEGALSDGNNASMEFREYLSNVSSSYLKRYADECLNTKFDGSGFALQDIVNEIGQRLNFKVTPGRYRGTSGNIGFDGLWLSPEAHNVIAEVKTTDAYRIDLNTIAEYRNKLALEHKILKEQSSILIIVGRQDTGDLEAQIRGSRHAWDIRLISVDALIRLLSIKEEVEDPNIGIRIRAILVPREYTRVDDIIELVFSTTEDVLHEEAKEAIEPIEINKGKKFVPVSFTDKCILRVQKILDRNLIKRSRAIYTTADNTTAVVCAVSKLHDVPAGKYYWFACHPHQKEVLEKARSAYISFGCGSEDKVLMIPYSDFQKYLDGLNQTHREDGSSYWHVQIFDEGNGILLHQKKGQKKIDISKYLIK